MKKALSIFLILAFFMQVSGNLWIMAAFYLNRNYIAANLCINRFDKIPVCKGACFLGKKLAEHEGQQGKAPGLKLNEIAPFHQPAPIDAPAAAGTQAPVTYYLQNQFFNLPEYPRSVFRPPCVSA